MIKTTDNKHEETVIKDYRIEGNKITIMGCTKEKLLAFKAKLENEIKETN